MVHIREWGHTRDAWKPICGLGRDLIVCADSQFRNLGARTRHNELICSYGGGKAKYVNN